MLSIRKLGDLSKTLSNLRSWRIFQYCAANKVSTNSSSLDENLPIEMDNPYKKEMPKCLLCQYDLEPNYKNVRLLSQFISKFTGRVYGRHITGLCEYKQLALKREIAKAQRAGLMAYYYKEPKYLADPTLYNEFNPIRIHKYI